MRTAPFARAVAASLLLLFGAACASKKPPATAADARTRSGTTEMELLGPPPPPDPGDAERTEFPHVRKAPEPLDQPLPSYPSSAVADGVACTARLLYHTELDGTASVVRLEWDVSPPAAHTEAFDAAVRDAVARWRFSPARELVPKHFPDGTIEPEWRPIRFADRAVIRFRVLDGRGVVD